MDREQFEELVLGAQITDETGNALRRALLFRRRGHMWRELPSDTQWWEVQIEPQDLGRVSVFPRAQWRRVADGSFLAAGHCAPYQDPSVSRKHPQFHLEGTGSQLLPAQHQDDSAVLLIGIDDENPVTVLEGNHRLTAALLASPEVLQNRFRLFCGFSPRMSESCWYQTNVPNLWRYARNRARNLFYDRDADVERVMKPAPEERSPPEQSAMSRVAATKAYTNSK